jgi:hypothetical protein
MAAKKLTADDIATAIQGDFKVEVLHVPEWGGDVYIRTLSAADRDNYSGSIQATEKEKPNVENFRARLVARCLCGEDGSPFYADAEVGATTIGGANSAAIEKIFQACRKLNAMTDKDLAEMEKN